MSSGSRGGASSGVAIAIADDEGLEAVSMRRLARELRSGAMSLYHYFDNRDELLELMSDTVAGEMVVPELPAEWRPAVEAVARASRDMFRRHTWVLPTFQDVPAVTPNLLRHIEQSARSVVPLAGTDPALLSGIVTAVDDYTVGFTLRELERGGARRGPPAGLARTSATCSRAASSRWSRGSSRRARRCRRRTSRAA